MTARGRDAAAPGFGHDVRVRYNECDPQGVVFNAWFLVYYDVALTEFLREVRGSSDDIAAHEYEIVVAEASIRYRAPVRFDDCLRISLSVARLGRTSFVVEALFSVDDRLVADAQLRHVLISSATGGKTEIPPSLRAGLAPYGTG